MEKDIKIPYHVSPRPGAEYFLRVSFYLATDKLWAQKGFEVASQQFELPVSPIPAKQPEHRGYVTVSDSAGRIVVKGMEFSMAFDKTKGIISNLEKDGVSLLRPEGGPMLHLWRAPHQIDDMWAYRVWMEYGLNALTWVADEVKYTQVSQEEVDISATLTGTGKENFYVHHKVVYAIHGSGLIDVINNVDFSKPGVILARMGVRMFLNKDLDRFDYLGRGPMENYADRKQGFDVGHYSSTVNRQLTPYEKPMECGNHEDTRWASLRAESGVGITVGQDTALLQVSALPYSDEELDKAEYRIDLPPSKATVLCISQKTLGVGSNGCGPQPLEPYLVYAKPTSFSYQIHLSSGNGQ
jgi:beta-galactosidase